MKSYREYEEQHIKRAEELSQQKAELASRAGKLTNQVEFEESVDWRPRLSTQEERIDKFQATSTELAAREKEVKRKQEQVQSHWSMLQILVLNNRTFALAGGRCCFLMERMLLGQIASGLRAHRANAAASKRVVDSVSKEVNDLQKTCQQEHARANTLKQDLDNKITLVNDLKTKQRDLIKARSHFTCVIRYVISCVIL